MTWCWVSWEAISICWINYFEHLQDPNRTILGKAQTEFVKTQLSAGQASQQWKLLHQQATSQAKTQDGGSGFSWSTCSLMTPEQRAMMPACDGQMLEHHAGSGVAVSLTAPEAFRFSFESAPERHLKAASMLAPDHAKTSKESEQLPSALNALNLSDRRSEGESAVAEQRQ